MVFSPGKQWDPAAFAQAQEILKKQQEQKQAATPESHDIPNKPTAEQITGQPAGMAGMEGRSLRPPRSPEAPAFYQPPVGDKKVRYIPPTQEKTLPGQKAPVIVPMEGNPNIPNNFQDLPTPPPPPDWVPPTKPTSNPVMYEVPPAPQTKKGNQVQFGMKPPVPPQQI